MSPTEEGTTIQQAYSQYSSCKADTGAGEKAGPRCRLDSWSSFVELIIPPRQRDWGQR